MCVGDISEILPQRNYGQPDAQPLHQPVVVVLSMSERVVSERPTPSAWGLIAAIHTNDACRF